MTETPQPRQPHGEGDHEKLSGVKDVDMEPSDHLNRPDQPDFDPAEREPYDDPETDVLPTSDEDLGST